MPIKNRNLGDVLLHIYEFPFYGTIYLPDVTLYEVNTPCLVAWAIGSEEPSIHESCVSSGFKNWLNVAEVSDICDAASDQTEKSLTAAFDESCRQEGSLSKMMNYRG
jgi:hypothetical protein